MDESVLSDRVDAWVARMALLENAVADLSHRVSRLEAGLGDLSFQQQELVLLLEVVESLLPANYRQTIEAALKRRRGECNG